MTIINRPVTYKCDFCGAETGYPEYMRWFKVGVDAHACVECGHKFHKDLRKAGFEHIFECHQYSLEDQWGKIEAKK